MRIRDWSSDVCSSDLQRLGSVSGLAQGRPANLWQLRAFGIRAGNRQRAGARHRPLSLDTTRTIPTQAIRRPVCVSLYHHCPLLAHEPMSAFPENRNQPRKDAMRLPPQCAETEQAELGCLMLAPEALVRGAEE